MWPCKVKKECHLGGVVLLRLVHEYIDGWTASPTQWTWVWINSGSWWWIGRPCVLQSMGSKRVRHNWATELNWTYWCQENIALHGWAGISARGEVCAMRHTECAVGRERQPNGREKYLFLKFFLSCHKVRILFHLKLYTDSVTLSSD